MGCYQGCTCAYLLQALDVELLEGLGKGRAGALALPRGVGAQGGRLLLNRQNQHLHGVHAENKGEEGERGAWTEEHPGGTMGVNSGKHLHGAVLGVRGDAFRQLLDRLISR